MGLADRPGDLFRVYPWGSWISQPGKNSALWFRGVVGSAVVICFLSVPIVWGSEVGGCRG